MTRMDIVYLKPVRVPAHGTQCYRALRAMQDGEKLTIWNAMNSYGIGALHQRMNDLREMGWPIKREEVTRNGKRVAEFSMEMERVTA